MNKILATDSLIAIGMTLMFAYGVFIGTLEGNYGYISVLVCGIIVTAFVLVKNNVFCTTSEGGKE